MFKNKIFSSSSIVIMSLLILSQIACVDLDFDTPPAGGFDPNLPVNTTIAELKAVNIPGQFKQITEDWILSGIVISNDEAGNFFKQLVIQDSTGGIEIRVEMTDIHNIYPPGRKVYVKAKGLWLNNYRGTYQLSGAVDVAEQESIRIPESLVSQYVIPATFGNQVIPKTLTIDQFSLEDVSTLVKLENVQFIAADAGEIWADAILEEDLNRTLEDCARRRVLVRTSSFAKFASELTPEGNGTFMGVLGRFDDDYQFLIRDLNDVMMTGDRCSSSLFALSAIRDMFTGSPSTLSAGTVRGVVTSDRSSLSVTERNLYLQDATGGIVIRFTSNHSFNLGDEISIDIAGATLNEFNGLLQIDAVGLGAATLEGHPGDIIPRTATIAQILANAEEWESTLVKIENVTLSGNATYQGSINVSDGTGSIVMFTRNAAIFASDPLPSGTVTLIALVTQFNTPQLLLRRTSDVF